ncbi:MAG: hypothetical protein ACI8WB_005571 [Phenylobacterium sp.]|jgi:hypothetical protein
MKLRKICRFCVFAVVTTCTTQIQAEQTITPNMTVNAQYPSGFVYGNNKTTVKFTGKVTNCGPLCKIRGKVYNAADLNQTKFNKLAGNEILQGTDQKRTYTFEWECPLDPNNVFTDCLIELKRGTSIERQVFSYIAGTPAVKGSKLPAVLDLILLQQFFDFVSDEASLFVDKFQNDLIYGWDHTKSSGDNNSPFKGLDPLLPLENNIDLGSTRPSIGGASVTWSSTELRMYPEGSGPEKPTLTQRIILGLSEKVSKQLGAPVPKDQKGVLAIGKTNLDMQLNASTNQLDMSFGIEGKKGMDPVDRANKPAIFFQGQRWTLSGLGLAINNASGSRCWGEVEPFAINNIGLNAKIGQPNEMCKSIGPDHNQWFMLDIGAQNTRLKLSDRLVKVKCQLGIAQGIANIIRGKWVESLANTLIPKVVPQCVGLMPIDTIFGKSGAVPSFNGSKMLNVTNFGNDKGAWSSLNLTVGSINNPLVPSLTNFRRSPIGNYNQLIADHNNKLKNHQLMKNANIAVDIREDALNYAAFRLVQEGVLNSFEVFDFKTLFPGWSLRYIRNKMDKVTLTVKTPPVFTIDESKNQLMMHFRNLMISIKGKNGSDVATYSIGADIALNVEISQEKDGEDYLSFRINSRQTDILPIVKILGANFLTELNSSGKLDNAVSWAAEYFLNQMKIAMPDIQIPGLPDGATVKLKQTVIGKHVNPSAPPSIYLALDVKRK